MGADKKKPDNGTIGVSTRVPATLWKQVKTHCVKAGVTVQAFLIGLMEKAVHKKSK